MKKEDNKDKVVFEKVRWEQIEEFVEKLATQCEKDGFKPTGVCSLPRGGLPLAVLLSHRMDIPLLLAPTKGCIIIDDIADTGKSLIHYRPNEVQVHNFYIATMYWHQRSIVKPDFYMLEKTDKWVVFPWERDAHLFENRKGAY